MTTARSSEEEKMSRCALRAWRDLQKGENALSWLFVAICIVTALCSGPNIGSVLLLVVAGAALPIAPVRRLWGRLLGTEVNAYDAKEKHRWWDIRGRIRCRAVEKEHKNQMRRSTLKPVILLAAFLIAFSVTMAANEDAAPNIPVDNVVSGEEGKEDFSEGNDPSGNTDETNNTAETPVQPETQLDTPDPQPEEPAQGDPTEPAIVSVSYSMAEIPAYAGNPYVELHGNEPYFTEGELTTDSFELYSDLDTLGRCGTAYACIGQDLMPNEPRGEIGMIKPSGWHTVRYDTVIEDKFLYNRCHLIGYQLTGENANEKNLITGTRFFNLDGMLPFENMVYQYIVETGHHVLYRVTPVYEGDNLVASGVVMEALSVEDEGMGIKFCVFCFNVQPGIGINYTTGESWLESPATEETGGNQGAEEPVKGQDYVLNTNTRKFHYPYCDSADKIKPKNRKEYSGTREEVIAMGYEPCKRCNP